MAGGEKVRRAGGPRGRGAGKRVLPWRHLAGLPSPRRHCAPGCALAAARPSCGEQRRRWAAAAAGSLAAPLSHSRSETRLRRALRLPARRAAPTSARGAALTPRGSPPPPPSPRPFPSSTDVRSRPRPPPRGSYVTFQKSPAPAPLWVNRTRLPPALTSVPVGAAPQTKRSPFMGQWNSLNGLGRLESL